MVKRKRYRLATIATVLALAIVRPARCDLSLNATPANLPSAPSEMVAGSDGNLWILTEAGNLGKVAPGGAYTEYPLQLGKSPDGFPNASGLTFGADANVWVIGANGHIERVTNSGTVTDFALSAGWVSQAMTTGADGAVWFTYRPPYTTINGTWSMGRVDIYGQFTSYDLGIGSDSPQGLVTGGDGNLWFIDTTKNQVVQFSVSNGAPAGKFAIPSASNQNGDDQMTLGPDGNVWFTRGTSLDRIAPDGSITEFHTPSAAQPAGIASGADGNIWFTEYQAGKLGQLVVSSISSGGNATINESAPIAANNFKLYTLPSGFTSAASGPSEVHALAPKPCPLITFITKITPPTGGTYITTTTNPTGCADMQAFATLLRGANSGRLVAYVRMTNNGPDPAQNAFAIGTISPSTPIQIATIEKDGCKNGTITSQGLTVTLQQPSLGVGETCYARILFNDETRLSASIVTLATSGTPDTDPKNNVAESAIDTSVTGRGGKGIALDPDLSRIIVTPVVRGQ